MLFIEKHAIYIILKLHLHFKCILVYLISIFVKTKNTLAAKSYQYFDLWLNVWRQHKIYVFLMYCYICITKETQIDMSEDNAC